MCAHTMFVISDRALLGCAAILLISDPLFCPTAGGELLSAFVKSLSYFDVYALLLPLILLLAAPCCRCC
jgi:hypothetical protein